MNKYKLISSIAVFARRGKAFDKFKIVYQNDGKPEDGLPIECCWQAITYIFKPRSKFFHFSLNEDIKYLLTKQFNGEKGAASKRHVHLQ
jgi:hypothetical protein